MLPERRVPDDEDVPVSPFPLVVEPVHGDDVVRVLRRVDVDGEDVRALPRQYVGEGAGARRWLDDDIEVVDGDGVNAGGGDSALRVEAVEFVLAPSALCCPLASSHSFHSTDEDDPTGNGGDILGSA